MVRLCERPGCSTPADVSYGFDAEHLVVWLDGFHAAQGVKSGVLCRRHADAMVVPLGWMLDDRREPAPRLFRPPAEQPTGPMVRPRARRPRADAASHTVQLQLDDYTGPIDLASAVVEAVSEAVALAAEPDAGHDLAPTMPATAPDETEHHAPDEIEHHAPDVDPDLGTAADESEAPWQPVFDEHDDLQGLLKARGRLLSRAFHGVAADGS
ncbi:MAG: hypothetical protein AB7L17_21055 [Ilumatobacteraceae bacterium]